MAVSATAKIWTLKELDSLPDDGNVYELIHGELFVTPPPAFPHETIAAKLTRLLDPFVIKHNLGYIYHPRSVIQTQDSQVEPDLAIRRAGTVNDWKAAPVPILVVEILSPYTRRRDWSFKRDFYIDEIGVPEYWIVDRDDASITAIRKGMANVKSTDEMSWHPPGVRDALTFAIPPLFAEEE